MSRYHWEYSLAPFLPNLVDVAVAHTSVLDLNDDIRWSAGATLEYVWLQRLMGSQGGIPLAL
jgi:hypothetical protein